MGRGSESEKEKEKNTKKTISHDGPSELEPADLDSGVDLINPPFVLFHFKHSLYIIQFLISPFVSVSVVINSF